MDNPSVWDKPSKPSEPNKPKETEEPENPDDPDDNDNNGPTASSVVYTVSPAPTVHRNVSVTATPTALVPSIAGAAKEGRGDGAMLSLLVGAVALLMT